MKAIVMGVRNFYSVQPASRVAIKYTATALQTAMKTMAPGLPSKYCDRHKAQANYADFWAKVSKNFTLTGMEVYQP